MSLSHTRKGVMELGDSNNNSPSTLRGTPTIFPCDLSPAKRRPHRFYRDFFSALSR